jgi:pyruvate dehydrogenase E1 component
MHPGAPARVPYVTQCLGNADGVLVAASDYVKALPDAIDRWLPRRLTALGTDGFGRSEGRSALRNFFEVDAKHIVAATLNDLAGGRDRRKSCAAGNGISINREGESGHL